MVFLGTRHKFCRASRTNISRRALYRDKEIPAWIVFPFLRIVSFWPSRATWAHVRGTFLAGSSPVARNVAALIQKATFDTL
jgi:hypothetical protein